MQTYKRVEMGKEERVVCWAKEGGWLCVPRASCQKEGGLCEGP